MFTNSNYSNISSSSVPYPITITAIPNPVDGGTITATVTFGKVIQNGNSITIQTRYGETVTVDAVPNVGFTFSNWADV